LEVSSLYVLVHLLLKLILISDPVTHTLCAYLGPVHSSVYQSLSNFHDVPRDMFEMFNSDVAPVASSWVRVTHDDLLRQFTNATPMQVKKMWDRFDEELPSFGTEDLIRPISNKRGKDKTRLPLYKENLAGLKDGKWVGNSIIDFFAWKLFKRIDMAGVKDVYKQFRIMDSAFMYYMHITKGEYYFNVCRRWVTKRTVDDDGHVWSFLSHDLIFVPVHKSKNHWVLFVRCPPNQEINVIDSLSDRIQGHVTIFDNLEKFIHDYQKSKDIPQDRWTWYLRAVVVKKKDNYDNCGVCLSLAIYCLVHELDYCTMPPVFFSNQARLFMFYIVSGYQCDQDDTYECSLDEVTGTITIVDDESPGVEYRDDANRVESGQLTPRATNPPPLPQVTAADLKYPNEDGQFSESNDEPEYPLDADYTEDMRTNLGEHEVTSVLGLTGMANDMDDRKQEQLAQEENDGEIHKPASEAEEADNVTEENRRLRNQVAEADQEIKIYQENSDSTKKPY
jgi:hypothetical protein